ncbi:PhzF family phenazine biosynthesis protein [Rhodopirellula bahusiensis]|uniref:Oxidoreductase n=1 Tax=Rhodopirellula bahusiensis TaxID=2014065 RepID=A0A2G1W6Y0_9BACT|nr:PhzF family phenazine biosynthesis protein [Rhodopirellula bahusiensis]PHQ34795.1 oxidoreductase [Rhodopirellula bahusiensis]
MSSIKCWQVDAFTDRPFGGNSAAVCFLEQEAPDEWMQAVAAEMNLSETAFLRRSHDGYSLRWFTPQVEVPLCGHATLASAHAIWSAGIHPQAEPIRFHTKSGVLACQQSNGFIEMDFPTIPVQKVDPPHDLLTVLGVSSTDIGKTQFDHMVVVEDAETVRSMSPDFRRLTDIPTRGVIVTSRSDDAHYDFVSRFFAPALGIDEDPVTGAAHCCLGPYWAEVLGKTEMTAFQASARGGVVQVRVLGDRVCLGGQAVTVWQGGLLALP